MDFKKKPLFILELANNHMGSIRHGLKIIEAFHNVISNYPIFQFAFKLQYRDLDTFIHPTFKGTNTKYVKRFEETRLTREEFKQLKDEIVKLGHTAICTPFDETSVDLIVEHGYDIIKVGSCSFTDWPLLEKISKVDKPIILSTAGASANDIYRVVSFFQHRNKEFALMHCVGEYPTKPENYELGQIAFLCKKYPNIPIGYSTHEDPIELDAIKLAISLGATIFERHIGVEDDGDISTVNAYSSEPEDLERWLSSAQETFIRIGSTDERRKISDKEKNDLMGLKRGIYAKGDIKQGTRLTAKDVYFAIPNIEGQVLANNFSKYMEYITKKDIKVNEPIILQDCAVNNLHNKFLSIIPKIKELLKKSNVTLPDNFEFEISHHYGIDLFERYGATIIRCINREYGKTIIFTLPGQINPTHTHIKKEETFQVLYGDLIISIGGIIKEYKRGNMVTVERGMPHSFTSKEGAVFEEISTTHYKDDSIYEDEKIMNNKDRKTMMTFWMEWLNNETI